MSINRSLVWDRIFSKNDSGSDRKLVKPKGPKGLAFAVPMCAEHRDQDVSFCFIRTLKKRLMQAEEDNKTSSLILLYTYLHRWCIGCIHTIYYYPFSYQVDFI
uniref:Uncharacterized protein n=1 Tax=Cacopsylla melanoneura TaxID=428564 RepID=A0A8D8Z6S4_9HEMI